MGDPFGDVLVAARALPLPSKFACGHCVGNKENYRFQVPLSAGLQNENLIKFTAETNKQTKRTEQTNRKYLVLPFHHSSVPLFITRFTNNCTAEACFAFCFGCHNILLVYC